MIKEIWKPILGYEEKYMASNLGRIMSLNYHRSGKERIMDCGKDKDGYLRVTLRKDGRHKTFRVNRLIWSAFNGPIPEGMQVNHINEILADNRLDNLNLMTCTENLNYGHHNARMIKSLSKMVEQYTLEGVHIMTWFSATSAKNNGYNRSCIQACCTGKRKTYKGYIWKYKEENSLRDA